MFSFRRIITKYYNHHTVEYMQPLFNHTTTIGAPALCCLLEVSGIYWQLVKTRQVIVTQHLLEQPVYHSWLPSPPWTWSPSFTTSSWGRRSNQNSLFQFLLQSWASRRARAPRGPSHAHQHGLGCFSSFSFITFCSNLYYFLPLFTFSMFFIF